MYVHVQGYVWLRKIFFLHRYYYDCHFEHLAGRILHTYMYMCVLCVHVCTLLQGLA